MSYAEWLSQVKRGLVSISVKEMSSGDVEEIFTPLVKRGYLCLRDRRITSEAELQETFNLLDRMKAESFISFGFMAGVLETLSNHFSPGEAEEAKLLAAEVQDLEKAFRQKENVSEVPSRRSMVYRDF